MKTGISLLWVVQLPEVGTVGAHRTARKALAHANRLTRDGYTGPRGGYAFVRTLTPEDTNANGWGDALHRLALKETGRVR